MRTNTNLPDVLLRKTKAVAALPGTTQLAVRSSKISKKVRLPLVRRRKIDLQEFDFDDLLSSVADA